MAGELVEVGELGVVEGVHASVELLPGVAHDIVLEYLLPLPVLRVLHSLAPPQLLLVLDWILQLHDLYTDYRPLALPWVVTNTRDCGSLSSSPIGG